MATEDIFLPGKFTDLTDQQQLFLLNELLLQMLDRLNQIDPMSIGLSLLTGDAAGKVLATQGAALPPVYSATPTVTGLTATGLTASQFVMTGASKELTSTASPTGVTLTGTTSLVAGSSGNTVTANATGITLAGTATVFEDLQVSINNIRLPAANFPAERLYAHGIGGGVTFPVLGFDIGEYIYFDVQSTHAMKLNVVLDNHIHYTTPTDGTGTKFKFQLDVIAAAIDGTWAVPTGSPYSAETTMSGDFSTKHKYLDICEVAAVNSTLSTLYKCKLTRIAASGSEYGGEVYLEFTDCHHERDTLGSNTETSKT